MKLFDLISDSDPKQQKKKLLAIYSVIATLMILVALIVALCVTSIVNKGNRNDQDISTDTEADEEMISDGIPAGYVEKTFDPAQLYSGSLILINDANPVNAASANTYILLQNYTNRPKTPAGSNTYTVDDKTSKATPEAADALNKMLGDYYKQNADDNLVVASADATSGMVFNLRYFVNYSAGNPDLTKAGIYGVQKYNWIYENAYKYGFISLAGASADGSEPENANLFRYVGVAHATAMKQKKLSTLEAYLDALKSETSVSRPMSISTADGKLKIYYCAADATAYISEKNVWEVSGNNVDGYIITVNTSAKAESVESTSQAE